MTPEQVRAVIIEVAAQIQSQSQRDVPPMNGDTRLIGDLPGFDSLNAVEFTILLTDALGETTQGRQIPDRIVLGGGKNARPTIDEIAQRTAAFLSTPASPKKAKGQAVLPTQNGKGQKGACDEQTAA
jgi:acyl carrier protein